MNDEDRAKLSEELQRFLDAGGEGAEQPHSETSEDWDWDKQEIFREKIEPLLEQISDICHKENMSFLFSIVLAYEKGKGYRLGHSVGMYDMVCEYMACIGVLNLPHRVSHMVIDIVIDIGKFLGLNPFKPHEN